MAINNHLGSKAINVAQPKLIRKGNNSEIIKLVSDIKSGEVKGLITAGINPGFTLPNADEYLDAFEKLELSVAFATKVDETATAAQFIGATFTLP